MSVQVTTAFTQQFTQGVALLAQQKNSRLRSVVRTERISNGDRAFFDQIGSIKPSPVTTRHADTPLVDTPHSRRMVTLTPYKHADLIDKSDMVRTLNDFTNPYTMAFAAGFGRALDQVVIDAAFATASTGVDGSSSASFDTSGYRIASGSAGLTIPKLTDAKQRLDAAENEGPYTIVVTAKQIEDLLNNTTASSADYNTVKTLARGEIDSFVGFKFVRSELLGVDGSNDRRCIAFAQRSLLLGIGEEPSGRISERADKNYSTQVWAGADFGATRMDATGVVEILCTE